MGRKNGFLRIKNKYEPVYKSPAFLRNTAGIVCITESGIFQTGGAFSKVYQIKEAGEEGLLKLCKDVREMETDYGFLLGKDGVFLLLSVWKNSMQEAQEWFLQLEGRGFLECLSAEGRLARYAGFLSAFLGTKERAESYLADPSALNMHAGMEGAAADGDNMKTAAGVYQVMAVRRFADDPYGEAVRMLAAQEAAAAAYVELSAVANRAVADKVESEYLGLDGVMPRMKRNGPLLYGVLKGTGEVREGSFAAGAVYFLLHAREPARMKQEKEGFLRLAESYGMRVEAVPYTHMAGQKGFMEAAAVFGMTGKRPDRYKSILPSDAVWHMVFGGSHKAAGETYDIEEMRELFFEEEGKEQHIQAKDFYGLKKGGPAQ